MSSPQQFADTEYRKGDKVRLNVPENPRLHGALATIEEVTAWGAHVSCKAAATGRYRAARLEMVLEHRDTHSKTPASNGAGYTGDVCPDCQGLRMRRNGSCLLCDDCGATSGCS